MIESNNLLMLRYICSMDADEKYVAAMNEFASSEFASGRGEFARSVPIYQVAHGAVDALKGIILQRENHSFIIGHNKINGNPWNEFRT